MAMRPIRTSGAAVAPSRRRPVGLIYEDFKPLSEWRRQDEADTLLVHLPGFMKEMIKVTTENRNIVRIRGERVLSANKWSRFQEDYQVPEYCDMRGIRAKFEGGMLAITMPRKTIATVVSPRVVDSTPRIRTKQDQETQKNLDNSGNKLIPSPRAFLEKQDQTHKEPNIPRVDAEKRKERSSDNDQLIRPPKKADVEKENEKSLTSNKASEDRDIIPRVFVPTSSTIADAEKQQNHHPREVSEGGRRGKEPMEVEKSKKDIQNVTLTSPSYKADDYKKMVVKGLGVGKNEERELLVNMGVAVLVIVALGTYVSYTTFKSLSRE